MSRGTDQRIACTLAWGCGALRARDCAFAAAGVLAVRDSGLVSDAVATVTDRTAPVQEAGSAHLGP